MFYEISKQQAEVNKDLEKIECYGSSFEVRKDFVP